VRAPSSGRPRGMPKGGAAFGDRGRKPTGSYEGCLPIEGVPDHHEPKAFTSRRSRWSRRLSRAPTPADEGRLIAGARERGDRDVRGTIARERRGKNTPTRRTPRPCGLCDPPKRRERRENAGDPGQVVRSPDCERRPRGESRGSAAGNVTGYVCTQHVRVAEVDGTHRAPCPSGGRKPS
jgi:hypothetical protein